MSLSVQIEQGNSYSPSPAQEPQDICLSAESFPDIARHYREELAISLEHTASLVAELDEPGEPQAVEDATARDLLGREIDFEAADQMIRATIIPFDYEPEMLQITVCGEALTIQSPFARASAAEIVIPDPAAPAVGIEHVLAERASTPAAGTSDSEMLPHGSGVTADPFASAAAQVTGS